MAFDYTDGAFATPLLRAIVNCDPKEVKEALNKGYSSNLPDNRGWTPLHEAANDDSRSECLKEILAHGQVSINSQTFQGETALFLACEKGLITTVKLLLKVRKCNVNLPNSEGVSPLHVACLKGNLEVVKGLIKFGAKVNSQDFNGYTPLHEAVAFEDGSINVRDRVVFDICQYILRHGGDSDIAEYEGNYPFHLACQNGLLKSSKLLLAKSKQFDTINMSNNDGRTPLMMAVQSKNLKLLEEMLAQGADPNVADKSGITALHLAAHTGCFDIFDTTHKATSDECLSKYCTFDEERDFSKILKSKRIHSLICLAIDTEDLDFVRKVLRCSFISGVLECPVIHAENLVKKSFTLHSPVSFLLESKMYDLGSQTLNFLEVLIENKSPLKITSKQPLITYINPLCAGLVALNDCPRKLVLSCLEKLLKHEADPDEPYGRMPFAMEQACMRGCTEAVLLLLENSNVLEPEDVLKWIEQETSSNQEKTVEVLLPLAPYYKPTESLLPDLMDSPKRHLLLTPKVYPLANYCRSVIRHQLHRESDSPQEFRQKLQQLKSLLPLEIYNFLNSLY